MDNFMHKCFLVTGLLLGLLFATGSDAALFEPSKQAEYLQRDPYEPFNRVMFNFNEVLDKFILKPVATLYLKITPKPVVKGVSHFFANIDMVPTIINDLLQANFYQATSDTWRFGINTTVGILGFFDVASAMGLEPNQEDLGLTFAQWGYKNSDYLVLPFFGPSTIRDTVGMPINYYYFSVYSRIHPAHVRYRWYLAGAVSRRADLLRFQDVMEEATVDKYAFMRNAYMQRRYYLIQRNTELDSPYHSQ